ncbi:MAG TPA: DUF4215 domain-containing protein [Labilithrix sp.]|nr:DUF4215 domain-containing protein [Labilithrix sp.]
MSAGSTVVRFTGVALVAGLLSAAACSAEGTADPILAQDGGTAPSPETSTPEVDGGPGPDGAPVDTAKCGNLKLESGEACDDGNTKDNDGCNGACQLESAFDGDTCPGKAITLQTNGATLGASVTGSTTGAFNHYGSACGGGSGKDVVYTFTPSSSGKAIVKLTADYSAIVSARSTCAVSTSESKCADIAVATGGTTTMEVPFFQGTPVYLFVDGYGGSAGTFELDIELSQAVCGNGIGELPEACDDGNTIAGDGCSPTCTLEGGGIITQCPGQPFALGGPAGQPRRIGFSGNTLTQGESTQNAAGCFYSTGSNVVYALKSDIAGSVKAELLAGYTKVGLHARSDCGSDDFQLGCTQRESPGTSTLTFPTKAGEWFYVIVDGYESGSNVYGGPFSLDVTVTPAVCGNHVLDGEEQCDDGNADAGDGCAPGCLLEALPAADLCPGHALTLAAQPDGSRTAVVSGTTRNLTSNQSQCALNGAGPDAVFAITPDIDGYLTANTTSAFNTSLSIRKTCAETFPDGGTAPVESYMLACSYKVTIPSTQTDPWVIEGVGNGPKSVGTPVLANTTYWVVVDGVNSNGGSRGAFELQVAVRPPVCGNGIIEGAETCDDGGTDANDGCDPTCKVEPITSRSTCGDAEAITLVETSPGNYSALLARGTTNLLANSNVSNLSTDDDHPCWAPGKNAFFAVTAPAAGVLRATAKSDAFDVVLNFRKPACALTTAPLLCANDSGKGNEEALALPVAAGETVYIVIDSKVATDWGRFSLDLSLTPSGCGDGFLVPGPDEECDDGNAVAGDGCTASCKLEPAANVDVCPGRPLTLTGSGSEPRKGTVTFATSNLGADYSGACGGGSRDGVVKVTAPISGFLRARTRGMFGSTVYARSVCNDPSTEFAKSKFSTCTSVEHETVTFQVTAGSDYYIFVDGLDGAVGTPTLDVTLTP